MNRPNLTGVTILEAITQIFQRAGQAPPRVVIDPTKGPSWTPSTNVVTIPAAPTHNLTDEEQAQLRAFFWHEAQGEYGNNTWWNDPAIQGKGKQRHMLANGIGDAYLDLLILADRPGAGADIRRQVDLDCQDLLKDGPKVKATVGLVACLARYLIEGVTTWKAVYKAIPQCAPLLDMVKPVLKERAILNSGKDVVALTLAIDAVLEQYKANDPQPEPEQGSGKGGKPEKSPKSPKGDKPDQPKQGDGDGQGEAQEDNRDLSLDKDDDSDSQPEGQSQPNDDAKGNGSGDGDDSGDDGEGNDDTEGESDNDDADNAEGNDSGKGSNNQRGGDGASGTGDSKRKPRDLDEGEDSDKRLADKLTEMLTGQSDSNGVTTARTFHEDFRAVVTGPQIDKFLVDNHLDMAYTPDGTVKHDASVLLVRLRAALQGPSLRIERNQEYGRFDARRSAAAISGSRTVYTRRREIKADSVAVSVCWDESYSMNGAEIHAVVRLVERFGLALSQMTEVVTEFTGWTTGVTPEEQRGQSRPFSGVQAGDTAHTAEQSVTHRLYKSFNEGPTVLGPRLQRINAHSGTPMVEALGFSAKRLAARPESRKVMFFLTDGEAEKNDAKVDAPWGYNALQYEVDRAVASGIMVVVFLIGADTSATMETELGRLTELAGLGVISAADLDRRSGVVRQIFKDKLDKKTLAWGQNARLVVLPADESITQRVVNTLVGVLTKQSRSIAV